MLTPIECSCTNAVQAKEFRSQIDWLASLTRDYCAYTANERETDAFQQFLKQLRQRAQYVAALYCTRSNRHNEYKSMSVATANSILSKYSEKNTSIA